MTESRFAFEPEFAGTSRFEVVRRLGAGGMGVVYEAVDRDVGSHVALKTLRDIDPQKLLLFKKEFRALQDFQHPNLVNLGELIEERGQWFFTMELVRGVDFLAYVRAPDLQEERLRAALAQLARGLTALHATRKIHRDIKPSNILVSERGRVVLLDFGLVTDLSAPRRDHGLIGTVGFMAPEQAGLRAAGAAADWYSVGVLLYCALTGRLPFDGVPASVLMRKQRELPPPPSAIAPVSSDLDELCMDLLQIDPAARPTGAQVLARLLRRDVLPSMAPMRAAPFVGRRTELDALRDAFAAARAGECVTVCVEGESGVGKTALMKLFLDDLELRIGGEPEVVVLSGRCYERESVPYKAVDGVVDALAQLLEGLPQEEAAALLPRSAALLQRVFPVLGRVEAFAQLEPVDDAIDATELRARSFAAMRELMKTLAQWRPLVVAIDDVQWADADGMALLAEVLRAPDAPPMLVLFTLRSPAAPTEVALPDDARRVRVGRLSPDEALDLAAQLVSREQEPSSDRMSAASIASEADGHPMFIDELVRHSRRARAGAEPQLEDALWARVVGLGRGDRDLLEVVAVAGAPIAQATAARAARIDDSTELAQRLAALRAANLVRTAGARGADVVEAYHDRVREAVVAHLDEGERRAWHERLALALEVSGRADAEALATHWRAAGNVEKGARYAALAARQAAASFAFDRAAALFRVALELRGQGHADARELRAGLADALADAGRGPDAAREYLAAAEGADGAAALELRRRATDQLLRSGHIDDGLVVARRVLGDVGITLPMTPRGALASLVWHRARLAVRGERYELRAPSAVTPSTLQRLDVCWSVAVGLSLVDVVRGADFQVRSLLAALEAGDPDRLARAFALAASFAAYEGGRAARRVPDLVARAESLARQRRQPYSLAWIPLARGVSAFAAGEWRCALAHVDEAHALFRDTCKSVWWELASAQSYAIWSLGFLGEMDELSRRVSTGLREARERGDLYAAMNLRTGSSHYARLAADDPEASRRESRDALGEWTQRGFHMQHFLDLFVQVETYLYEGRPAEAHALLLARWRDVERSLLFRMPLARIILSDLRARVDLAAVAARPDAARALLDDADRCARAIGEERARWARAIALALRAGARSVRGDVGGAIAGFDEAARAFDEADMKLHAASSRRAAGALAGDGARVAEADAWMRGRGIVNPARMAATLAPSAPRPTR